MAHCIECSSFDPYYKKGWCNYHEKETSPSDTCAHSDYSGAHTEYDSTKVCKTCEAFDSYYMGGYCDYHKCSTNSYSYCSDWSK